MSLDRLHAFSQLPLASTSQAGEATYEFSRLETFGDSNLLLPALIIGAALLLVYTWSVYRRESRTVSAARATLLATLRTLAIAGLVAFFLGYEKRSSTEVVEPSRVAILVDTSLSMELPNSQGTNADSGSSRLSAAKNLLVESPLIEQLRQEHDVELVGFGTTATPLAYFPQATSAEAAAAAPETPAINAALTQQEKQQLTAAIESTQLETRLGDAVADTLQRYRGLPLAGVVLLSDGGQNRGLEIRVAAEAADAAQAPVLPVGFGSFVAPANVAVRELLAPERAYPGDNLTFQAVVSAQRLAGEQIDLQLFRRPIQDNVPTDSPTWEPIGSNQIATTTADELTTVRFETNPTQAGRYLYEVRATVSTRESQQDDNRQQAEVTVVDRETHVLLLAGGPSRDYRFLRNQLRRDKSFIVDVLLETAAPGISQDANEILKEFPTSAQQLSKYDAIVGFDPDWSRLSIEQVEWLESWVSSQSGGLIVLPGRVNLQRWAIESRMRPLRGLYPVRIPSGLLDLRSDGTPRDKLKPLRLTTAGSEAEFLWLTDQRTSSDAAWQSFDGVYGGFQHNGPKPGATVYAKLAGETDDTPGPAYLASQYYGSGQVFYLGSSELWRLRKLSTKYYERLWTSLLRHTSQGRLLQGSPRGKLLLAQDRYDVGATVQIRATMTNAQLQPLAAENITLKVDLPTGGTQQVSLAGDPTRPGTFAGEMRVVPPGAYRLTLPIPESEDKLVRTIRVSSPQLEVGQTTRDEPLLRTLAQTTGGHYYPSPAVALAGDDTVPALVAALPSQARSKRVIGAVDQEFAKLQSLWLLGIVAGALSLEWLLRRLSHLA